eukprot:6191015-Pleurochrysis_carterae.AAC.1
MDARRAKLSRSNYSTAHAEGVRCDASILHCAHVMPTVNSIYVSERRLPVRFTASRRHRLSNRHEDVTMYKESDCQRLGLRALVTDRMLVSFRLARFPNPPTKQMLRAPTVQHSHKTSK